MEVLLKGIVLGFGIAAPVGPIGVLCIRRTLAEGRWVGLATGLGAATADALYGAVAAFGLTLVMQALVAQRLWLGLIGGAFLLVLGWRTFRAPPAQTAAKANTGQGLWAAFFSTFGLTLTNPLTILSFVAVFAGLGVAAGAGLSEAAVLVMGVFIGSALWWLTLTTGISLLRARVTPQVLGWVNRGAGVLIMAFGLLALWTAWQG